MTKMANRRLAFAQRLRGSLAVACGALLLLTSSAKAGSDTILQFSQINSHDFVTGAAGASGTTLSTMGNTDGGGTAIPVTVTNYLGNPFPPFPVLETFVGVHSVGAATNVSGTVTQEFAGTITFIQSGTGTNLLTATFTDAVFSGKGTSASLLATGAGLTFTSDNPLPPGITGMALSFTTSTIGTTGSPLTLAGFTGQNTGTFSVNTVPEPGTLGMMSLALAIGGALTYFRGKTRRVG
jgi:hypothetical protein